MIDLEYVGHSGYADPSNPATGNGEDVLKNAHCIIQGLIAGLILLNGVVFAETLEQRDERMAWWREARFGMFIHWGVYAVPAGEWNGNKVKGISEWIQSRAKIPVPYPAHSSPREPNEAPKNFNRAYFGPSSLPSHCVPWRTTLNLYPCNLFNRIIRTKLFMATA